MYSRQYLIKSSNLLNIISLNVVTCFTYRIQYNYKDSYFLSESILRLTYHLGK